MHLNYSQQNQLCYDYQFNEHDNGSDKNFTLITCQFVS